MESEWRDGHQFPSWPKDMAPAFLHASSSFPILTQMGLVTVRPCIKNSRAITWKEPVILGEYMEGHPLRNPTLHFLYEQEIKLRH